MLAVFHGEDMRVDLGPLLEKVIPDEDLRRAVITLIERRESPPAS